MCGRLAAVAAPIEEHSPHPVELSVRAQRVIIGVSSLKYYSS